MFKTKIKPRDITISNKLEKSFLKDKVINTTCQSAEVSRLGWAELMNYGFVVEEIDQNDDITVVTRKFTSYDKTQWRKSQIMISTEEYNKFISLSNVGEIENEIADIELEIEVRKGYGDINKVTELEDQLKFIKEEYGIKD